MNLFNRGTRLNENYKTIARVKGIRQRETAVEMSQLTDRKARSAWKVNDTQSVVATLKQV